MDFHVIIIVFLCQLANVALFMFYQIHYSAEYPHNYLNTFTTNVKLASGKLYDSRYSILSLFYDDSFIL